MLLPRLRVCPHYHAITLLLLSNGDKGKPHVSENVLIIAKSRDCNPNSDQSCLQYGRGAVMKGGMRASEVCNLYSGCLRVELLYSGSATRGSMFRFTTCTLKAREEIM